MVPARARLGAQRLDAHRPGRLPGEGPRRRRRGGPLATDQTGGQGQPELALHGPDAERANREQAAGGRLGAFHQRLGPGPAGHLARAHRLDADRDRDRPCAAASVPRGRRPRRVSDLHRERLAQLPHAHRLRQPEDHGATGRPGLGRRVLVRERIGDARAGRVEREGDRVRSQQLPERGVGPRQSDDAHHIVLGRSQRFGLEHEQLRRAPPRAAGDLRHEHDAELRLRQHVLPEGRHLPAETNPGFSALVGSTGRAEFLDVGRSRRGEPRRRCGRVGGAEQDGGGDARRPRRLTRRERLRGSRRQRCGPAARDGDRDGSKEEAPRGSSTYRRHHHAIQTTAAAKIRDFRRIEKKPAPSVRDRHRSSGVAS